MTQRMNVDERKTQLLDCGVKLAEKHGYTHVSRRQIANAAGVSEGLLSLHFGRMDSFRAALMLHAIALRNTKIIAQGLIASDPHAKRAPKALKQLALTSALA